MPVLKLEIDTKSLLKLTELAGRERRPVDWQAEVLILQALARWPLPPSAKLSQSRKNEPAEVRTPTGSSDAIP